MFIYCFRKANNKSVDPMLLHSDGLALSYSF